MRSCIEGWVEKRVRTPSVAEKGFTMKRLAVAGCTGAGMACAAWSSFSRARASASGSPEISAPVASAPYSREREIAELDQRRRDGGDEREQQ